MNRRGEGQQHRPFAPPDAATAVYVISVAAQLTGLHPQTLRTYEREGLITPGRTGGGGRRYSHRDIELLRLISDLTSAGIGLEGVRRILELERQLAQVQSQNAALAAELEATRDALRQALSGQRGVPMPSTNLPVLRPPDPGSQVVVWRRGR
jgi:MerR family transcriptional regulator, heat shock protein HspR